jgi:hypothetical protein
MKYIITIVLAVLLLGLPSPTSAHINGIPFLLVNNKPVLANPAFSGYIDQKMLVPQDLAPDKYLPGTKLNFTIDPQALGFPQETLNQSKLRWSWDSGDQQYNTELNPSHTYTDIGSHIVTMEILFPGNPEYIVYDTIQVDIVPHLGYQRPNTIITTNGINIDTTKEITFTQKTTTDPSASVESFFWKLDSGIYSSEAEPRHNYNRTNFFEQVYLQVKDSKGFLSTTVISVTNGQVANTVFPEVINTPDKKSTVPWIPIAILFVVLNGAAIIYWRISKNKK